MLFLAGPHGAGKTQSAQVLAEMGFMWIDLGPALRTLHALEAPNADFAEWIGLGEKMFGEFFTDGLLAEELKKLRLRVEIDKVFTDIVVVGSRSMKGIEYLAKNVPPVNGYGNRVIFIDASAPTLHHRYNSREGKNLSASEFQAVLDRDVAMGLNVIREQAHAHIWNEGTSEELREELKKILHGFNYCAKRHV